MKNQLFPCLWFDNQARTAADYYCSIFRNSKIDTDAQIAVTFELNGVKLMALNGGPIFQFTPSISLFVTCKTIAETDRLWNSLLEKGEVMMPIDQYPWSERYGWLKDRYGLTWQISLSATEESDLQITPSMLFTNEQFGRAEEAINYYTSIFSNSSVTRMIHYPAENAHSGKVMYAEFKLGNYKLIAMDGPGEHAFSFNEAISYVVECDTQEEIDYFWEKLTDGGLENRCGWLTDRFGVSWQIVPTILSELMSDPAKAPAVVTAFMAMKKFDIAGLRNAIKD